MAFILSFFSTITKVTDCFDITHPLLSFKTMTTTATETDTTAAAPLSADQAELYDRGIRLWGMDAQQRLGASTVLVLGMSEAAAEVCKNVVLAGIARLVVVFAASADAAAADAGSNMFVRADDAGAPTHAARCERVLDRVRALNGYVRVEALHVPDWSAAALAAALPARALAQYDYVCVCSNAVPVAAAAALDARCRAAGPAFLDIRLFGTRALLYCDMPLYDPATAAAAAAAAATADSSDGTAARAPKRVRPEHRCTLPRGPSYADVLALPAADYAALRVPRVLHAVRRLHAGTAAEDAEEAALLATYRGPHAEAAYVCAVVGGVAGQEVVKELMRDHQPAVAVAAAGAEGTALSTDAQRRRQQARHQRQNATGRPLCNVLCYDAVEGTGDVYYVAHSEAERASAAASAASAADATEIL